MVDSFNRQVLRVTVAQICQSMGWDALQKSTHDTLTDVLQRYLEEIGKVACSYTQLCNRTKPNLDDLHLAFQDTGVVLQELENFVAQVDPVQFIHPFTTYPKCQPCRLQHRSEGESVDRAEFYSEHLPPLPKTCQEPKDENEETTSGPNAKVANSEETEKMKGTPLKESSNVMDTIENVPLKRRFEGGAVFPRVNKRSRLDIPPNLIIEKKENLENTDGESLSPATPVSPYLPQELPKQPEVPAKPQITVKAKVEPKQVPNLPKEMVLPLQKLTPPEKKTKRETSPGLKKPKIKKEKSISPNVQSRSPLSSPKSHLLSPGKKPPGTKSPQTIKMKSLMTPKSLLVEKHVPKTSPTKVSEKKTSPLSFKSSPVKEFSLKVMSAPKKSPTVVPGKKGLGSPKVKEREFKPVKKKMVVRDEIDSGKSSHNTEKRPSSPSMSTPKLMIKRLPQSSAAAESPKSSPVERKISSTSIKVKTPSSPSSAKAMSMKLKTLEGESSVKSKEKVKIPSDLLEFSALKREHSKKKKKKKDKDKDKDRSIHKEKRKSDKGEPPIPKIRFKLDPPGESKSGETKTLSSTKSSSSSKKSSMIVIETENVMSSVITETLSNTLDYDPDRAYYCPVCHKQDDGSPMVGCDGCDEWCHWVCVGLIAAPPENEKWYCPVCLSRKEKKKKAKSKKKS